MAETTAQSGARGWGVIVAGVLAALAVISLGAHRPPRPLGEDAPAAEFSAMRALKHVEAFATVPHPAGTAANDRVRDYIVQTLESLGATPEIHEATIVHGSTAATPRNVVARFSGANNTKAFMLVAHYDSVQWGPGAADDGAAVAAMLETCRALKAGPPLRNDVIFLFTDGEEAGLLGAQSFVDNDPWARDVGLMVNFEARGTCGPSYLFETSPNNGWLIPHIAKAAPYPMTSSLMYDVYIRMPATSDFRVFKKKIPGMNAGFIGNLPYYHTPNDNPDNLDRGSLQHHGSYALGFARYFGNLDLANVPEAPDAVYFNTLGTALVHYPGSWNRPIGILASVLFILAGALGIARKCLSARGIVAGFLALQLTAIASALVVAMGLAAAYAVRDVYLLYRSNLYILASVALTLSVVTALYPWLQRRIGANNLCFGILFSWLIFMIALLAVAPGAAYLAQWPLVFASIGYGLSFLWPAAPQGSGVRTLLTGLGAIPAFVLLPPILYAFMVAVTVITAPAAMMIAAPLVVMLLPHLETAIGRISWRIPAASLALGTGLVVLAIGLGGFSEKQPKAACVSYGLNADTGAAFWISAGKAPDEWSCQFFPPDTPREGISEFGYRDTCLKAPAPAAPLVPPSAEVVEDKSEGDTRRVRLHVSSPRHAAQMLITVQSEAPLDDISVNDKQLGKKDKLIVVRYKIIPSYGIDIGFDAESGAGFKVNLVDYSYSLPDIPGSAIRARPPWMMSEPNTITLDRPFQSNLAMVAKSFAFAGDAVGTR